MLSALGAPVCTHDRLEMNHDFPEGSSDRKRLRGTPRLMDPSHRQKALAGNQRRFFFNAVIKDSRHSLQLTGVREQDFDILITDSVFSIDFKAERRGGRIFLVKL